MELIDFDGLFDEKLAVYMEENQDKYSEKQWEDVIPRLYQKFGDTYVAKVKCTPKEYYAKMTGEQLSAVLEKHLEEEVPVPEFLCAEIESRGNVSVLLPLLTSGDSQKAEYAVNLIGDNASVFSVYVSLLREERWDADVLDDVVDLLKCHADEVKEDAIRMYEENCGREYALEILSKTSVGDEKVYRILMDEFLRYGEKTAMRASYLSSYGDVRALEALLARIDDESIGFVEFQELKYAIEALGGEYTKPRDFTDDKDYLAVEAAIPSPKKKENLS